jgi:hypothetical protein
MVRRRGNPFANTLKRLPHKALMRRDEPLHRSDDDEVMAVMLSVAAGAEYLAYAGARGDELYCECSALTRRRRPAPCKRGSMLRASRAVPRQRHQSTRN